MSAFSHRRYLVLILVVYFVLGALYAVYTPLWQTPDEPAHYNFIRHLATTGSLPMLHPGDYDQAYLEEIKARRFPPDMPVDGIRYEGHQPPAYYVLATPVFLAARDFGLSTQALALRLLGVVLGGGVVLLVWASARRLFPDKFWTAALAAGFAAFLPMHLAMMASINNDALAELIIAAGLYRLLGHLKHPEDGPRAWLVTGILVGLGLVTKFQAYSLVPLTLAVWLWVVWQRRSSAEGRSGLWQTGLAWMLPPLLLALPWWIRNASLYGLTDPLGLNWHDAVVLGQPRTAEWIATHGWVLYLGRYVGFTFKSFWGVFGWLGVFMDGRVYTLLGLLSILVVVGLLSQWQRLRQGQIAISPYQKRGLVLLGLQLLIVAITYFWYNLSFVQHQGRYLFPALVAISIGFALGIEGLHEKQGSRWGERMAQALLVAIVLVGLGLGDINGWSVLLVAAAAVVLAINHRLKPFPIWLWNTAILTLLVLIDLYALFGAIGPQLR